MIERAKKLPACTDYSPSPKKNSIKITFGQKLIDILKKDKGTPGPGNYEANNLDI